MAKKKERMIKTSIDLPESQWRFLNAKAAERKLEGRGAGFVSILRELIEGFIEEDKKRKAK